MSRGIGNAMLGELERRLVMAGVHRVQCLLSGDSEIGALALEHAGYTARQGMVFYERLVPPRAIVLFGPPGTGKTTFAKGAASRRAARPGRAGGDLGPLPGCVLT
jgi:hypothetical protein